MEKEQEIPKLVNVLRRAARSASQAQWNDEDEKGEAASWCVSQYNRILNRVKELEPAVGTVFEPLEKDASLRVAGMACRQLAAWFEEETGEWEGASGAAFDPASFKKFWKKGCVDVQDLGETIRETIDQWAEHGQRRRGHRRHGRHGHHNHGDKTAEE